MVYRLFLIVILVVGAARALAERPAEWDAAATAFQQGELAEAVRLYEVLLQKQYMDPALFNNQGTCYFQMGELGKARLAFERGIHFFPKEPVLQNNLHLLKPKLADSYLEEVAEEQGTWQGFYPGQWLSAKGWFIMSLVLWYSALAGFLFAKWKKIHLLIRLRWLFGVLGVLALTTLGVGLFARYQWLNSDAYIVLPTESTLFLAPDSLSPEIRKVHTGAKVRVVSENGKWKQIRLMNGDEGWIPAAQIAAINVKW